MSESVVLRGDAVCGRCAHTFFRHLKDGAVFADSKLKDLECVLDDCACTGFLNRTPTLSPEKVERLIKAYPNAVPSETPEAVEHPAHYNSGKIEVWDFIIDQGLSYCLGDATKYICRAGKKDSTKRVQDLEKAKQYIDREIKRIQDEEGDSVLERNIKAFNEFDNPAKEEGFRTFNDS